MKDTDKSFMHIHYKKIVGVLLIILALIPLFLAVSFRSATYTLPVTEDWARSSIEQSIRNSLSAEITKQYPYLPEQSKQQLLQQQTDSFIQQHKSEIDNQTKLLAQQFRAQLEDTNGHTYLPDLDPYHFLKRTEQYLDHGYIGNAIVGGKTKDMQILAPAGIETRMDLFTWTLVQGYHITKVFTDTKPMYTLFWINLFFVGLATGLMLLIGRHKGWVASFIAAMIIAVHPSSVSRTTAGVGDTESLILFISLFAAWALIEAFETKKGDWKRLSIFLCLVGIAFGLLALVWEWWFFFLLFFAALIAHVAFHIIRHFLQKKSARSLLKNEYVTWATTLSAGYFVITGIFVSLFAGASMFFNAFSSAFMRTETIKAATTNNIWPNILTTVAELNQPDIATIINTMGGKFLFIAALLGLIFALLPKDRLRGKDWGILGFGLITGLFLVSVKGTNLSIEMFLAIFVLPVIVAGIAILKDERDVDTKYAFVLVAWLAASIFAMTKGVRFISLIIPPFAIAVAIALNAVYVLVRHALHKSAAKVRYLALPILFIVLCLPLFPLAKDGYQVGHQSMPNIDDGWWNALTKIKNESAQNAIITSWWDFGHWFRYVADRGVTFDGASQYGELAHFIGRSLSTNDEREALAILRLADCGSTIGSTKIIEYYPSQDSYKAIMLLKRITMMRHADARSELLKANISSEHAEEVLNLTHCEPPEAYFITSEDMTGKAGVWAHFGNWNFAKADASSRFSGMTQENAIKGMTERYGLDSATASQWYTAILPTQNREATLNSWISGWPSYISSRPVSCQMTDNSTLVCSINIALQTQGTTSNILDSFVINRSDYSKSFFLIKGYSQGAAVGEGKVSPVSLSVLSNKTKQYNFSSDNTLPFSVVFDTKTSTAVFADPALADAIYTRLFFFDGLGTSAFEKFDEERTLGGGRIIVWKVDWSKLKTLGLE